VRNRTTTVQERVQRGSHRYGERIHRTVVVTDSDAVEKYDQDTQRIPGGHLHN
jgi:hypothetical protein